MPSFEEDKDRFTNYTLKSSNEDINIYLWQHELERSVLLDLVKSRTPRIDTAPFSNLSDKRFKEKLSTSYMICRILGDNAMIHHKETGAPFVTPFETEISISHTDNIYAVSVSPQKHGIDVEHWGEKAFAVRSKFISNTENILFQQMISFGQPEKIATALWSAKESVYKYYDIPGLELLNDIRLTFKTQQELSVYLPKQNLHATVHLKELTGCVLTVCHSTK